MARPKRIDPFFIVITDDERKVFNVLGPMTDDTYLTNKIAACQDAGRQVRCHTAGRGQSRDQIISSYAANFHYVYTDAPIAV